MTEAVLDVGAVVAAVTTWLAEQTGLAVGNQQPPAAAGFPFVILYPLPLPPPVMANLADVETVWPLRIQASSVGQIPAQAAAAGTRVARVMAGRMTDGTDIIDAPTLAGLMVIRREPDRNGHAAAGDQLHEWTETFTWYLHLA